MIDWERLLQLVIVIVKPLTVSLYGHHKPIDRDRWGLGVVQQKAENDINPPLWSWFQLFLIALLYIQNKE